MLKRVFSMLLVVAMLLSFMPVVSLQAAATEETEAVITQGLETRSPATKATADVQEIQEVHLTSTTIAPGVKRDDVVLSVSDDANYVIDTYSFYGNNWDTFEEDGGYQLYFEVCPKKGYVFAEKTDVYFNGEEIAANVERAECSAWVDISFVASFIVLDGLPDGIRSDTPEVPEIRDVVGQVEIADVQWVNTDKQPVDALEVGKSYYLAISIVPKGDRYFDGVPLIDTLDGDEYEEMFTEVIDEKKLIVYVGYTLLQSVEEVHVTVSGIQEGAAVADISADVSDNAVLKGIEIFKYTYGAEESEYGFTRVQPDSKFEARSNYKIRYRLIPETGYSFWEGVVLTINGEPVSAYYDTTTLLILETQFSDCEPIEAVEMTLSDIVPGMYREDVGLSVSRDAPYILADYYINSYGDEEWDNFENGVNYELSYHLQAKEGYVFTDDTQGYINGEAVRLRSSDDKTDVNGWIEISFGVDEISLWVLPDEIQPGAAELPEPECNQEVKITDVAWVNEAKQPVTAFEEGEVYYLAVTVEATGTRAFGYEPDLDVGWNHTATFEKHSDKQAVIYVRYSLEPSVGMVDISVSGTEIGDKIENVEVEINGNALFDQAIISVYVPMSYDSYTTEEPDSDVFEAGKTYLMECYLQPKPGYRFVDGFGITVEGEPTEDWGYRGDDMMVIIPISTCQEIDTVTLTMPEIKVGKAFSDLQVKVPTNAKYTATVRWVDVTDDSQEATGKVQAGHRYEAQIILQAKDGYIFAEDAAATLNGKKIDIGQQGYGRFAVHWMEKSFLTPITKVELPAMPTSIKKGDTLPVPTVSDSKNYTLTAFWGMLEGDQVTKAEEDGIYLLVYTVTPKAGYTFNDDTKYYVGGKETWPLEIGWRDAQLVQNYNIGVDEITRIDIISQEPQPGEAVPDVTIPEDANYSLDQVIWGQSATGNWGDIDDVNKLQAGLYTYAYGMVSVNEGMALSKDAVFYLNGQKTAPMVFYNFGRYAIVLFNLGKLGVVEPMDAPKLKVEEEEGFLYLTWDEDPNATGYEIYRATSKSGKYTKVATVDWNFFSDDDAPGGKTYYYKVKAVNAGVPDANSGYSNVVKLAIKLQIPVVTLTPNDATGRDTLSWEKISGAKSYDIYRGTSMDNMKKYANTKKLTYVDTKAKVGVEYFYAVRAVASSKSYNSELGVVFSCVWACPQPVVKGSVDAATGKPALFWGKDADADGFLILRKLPGEETFTELTQVTGTSFVDTTAPIDTLCTYRVQALNDAQYASSAVSKEVAVTSGIARPKLEGTVNYNGTPLVNWQVVEGAVKYEVYRSTKATKSYKLLTTVEDGNVYADETATAGKTYYYKVVAIGEISKSAESAYVKLTGKCAAPVISVVNGSSGKPVISWAKVSGAKKYTVYRATSENGKYKSIGTTKSVSYTDSKATAGTEYFYKVVANGSKSAYNSIGSNICYSYVICGTPSVTIKVDKTTGKPNLSWSKITGAVKYRIYRQLPGEEVFTVIAEQTAVTFKDETAPIDTLCNYRVQALGAHEMLHGAYSKIVTATSGIAQPKLQSGVNSEGKPHFNWQQVEGAIKYEIYRSTKSTKSYKLLATVEDGNAYVDETVAAGKTYYYKVIAIGENSKSAESAYVKLTGKCAAPKTVVQTDEITGKPMITWEKVNGATQYTIYRSTDKLGGYKKLGTTKKLSYTDTKAAVGTTYFYKVVANHKSSKYSSGYSYPMGALTVCATPVVKLSNNVNGVPVVSWSKVTGATGYKVMYMDVTDYLGTAFGPYEDFETYHQSAVVTGTSFTLPETEVDRMYMISVVALAANEECSSAAAEPQFVDCLCARPQVEGLLSADGKPAGSWNEVEGAIYYVVYRSTKKSSGYKVIEDELESLFFIDDTAKKGKTYYYKVVAVSWSGESQMSDPIKLKSK